MAIKRFTASADNTITNAFKSDLATRATGSNMGKSDILEVFSIYAQSTSTSQEAARILINFDIAGIASARSSGEIPAAGSVNFYLRMFNAEHSSTLPENFNLVVAPLSSSWSEGTGLDMDEYQDESASNWINRQSGTAWTVQGGDFLTGSSDFTVEQTFTNGYEDLLVDVTQQVEEWVNDNTGSYGFGVFLTSSLESDTNSYYTKKFHARRSEYFLKRPVLEARWDSSRQDDSSKSDYWLPQTRLWHHPLLQRARGGPSALQDIPKGHRQNVPVDQDLPRIHSLGECDGGAGVRAAAYSQPEGGGR